MRSFRVWLVIGTAIVMAFLSAKLLFNGTAWNVLPWGILALATAYLASNRREAWAFGGLFGFVVSYAFLWFDNTDTKTLSRVAVLIAVIFVPALFGALCGFLAAWLGWIIRQAVKPRRS
jgi:Ni/Fe-hydrogenase subunit HybB-like protein